MSTENVQPALESAEELSFLGLVTELQPHPSPSPSTRVSTSADFPIHEAQAGPTTPKAVDTPPISMHESGRERTVDIEPSHLGFLGLGNSGSPVLISQGSADDGNSSQHEEDSMEAVLGIETGRQTLIPLIPQEHVPSLPVPGIC